MSPWTNNIYKPDLLDWLHLNDFSLYLPYITWLEEKNDLLVQLKVHVRFFKNYYFFF